MVFELHFLESTLFNSLIFQIQNIELNFSGNLINILKIKILKTQDTTSSSNLRCTITKNSLNSFLRSSENAKTIKSLIKILHHWPSGIQNWNMIMVYQ